MLASYLRPVMFLGFAAANTTQESILLAGVAALVAAAMSMAAGEYAHPGIRACFQEGFLPLRSSSLSGMSHTIRS
jgi:hypothetical protein